MQCLNVWSKLRRLTSCQIIELRFKFKGFPLCHFVFNRSGTYHFEDKISIIQHLIKWFLLGRNQCSIIQFQKGLEVLGVLDKMRQFPDLFRPLMCYSQNTLTVECFEANLSYEKNKKGSNAFHLENTALGYWGPGCIPCKSYAGYWTRRLYRYANRAEKIYLANFCAPVYI